MGRGQAEGNERCYQRQQFEIGEVTTSLAGSSGAEKTRITPA